MDDLRLVGLEEVRAAAARIAGAVRRTPLMAVGPAKMPAAAAPLSLKLECLQVTGSFKARGAVSMLRSLPAAAVARGLVTASGGNHGLGVAYAGWLAGVPARVYLPLSAPKAKAEKLARWGAEPVFAGAAWDESNALALAEAESRGLAYIHPFADRAVIAGQGTIGLEMLADDPALDTVLVAIGGGGLIAGVATALKALKPGIKVVGIEPTGAPTLHASLAAGHIVALAEVTTRAGTLAAKRTAPLTFAHVQRNVDAILLVSDEEMREAAAWLWFDLGLAVELSAAAALAALRTGRYKPSQGERVAAIVCGAGTDGLD